MINIVLLVGLGLRLIGINQSFWLDEATSGVVARDMNLSQLFTFIQGDFHPPLYYLLLHFWGKLFGYSEIALRLPSLLFGLGTIFLVYRISNRKLWAPMLLAVSGLHIYYSQEARMYAMSAFLVTYLFWIFLKLLKTPTKIHWLIFSFLVVANFWTDYLPAVIMMVFVVIALYKKMDRQWWKSFVLAISPLVVIALLWLPIFKVQFLYGVSIAKDFPGWWSLLGKANLRNLALLAIKFVSGRISWDNNYTYGAIVAPPLLLSGWLMLKAMHTDLGKMVKVWLFLPVAILYAVAIRVSVFNYFRFLFVLPAFYLLLALGLQQVKKPWQAILGLLLVSINLYFSSVYLFDAKFHRENWRGLVREIETDKTNFAFVLPTPKQREALYYYKPAFKLYYSPLKKTSFNNVYLLRYVSEIVDSQDLARQEIESLGYQKTNELDFNGVVVWKYGYFK